MSTSYVTADGILLIKHEFDYIWNKLRPDVTQKLSWAASLGDRSENADYQYNKRLLRSIDVRVKQISDTLQNAKVLDRSIEGKKNNKVYFGAYVEIENDAGVIKHVRIVGYPETYGRNGFISVESPMAKGLLNKTLDDEAVIQTPKGNTTWYINKISYQLESWYGEVGEPQFKFESQDRKIEILSDEDLKKIRNEYLSNLHDN
jgi:transcription elongation factor GreB